MTIEQQAAEVIDTLDRRFSSSNDIPVERATIKSDELAAILVYIAKIDAEKKQLEETLRSCEHQLGIARGA